MLAAARQVQGDAVEAGVLLALAYPDRVAQRRPGGTDRYLLRNGLGARVRPQTMGTQEYLVAAELDGRLPESEILLGAPISPGDIRVLFAADIVQEAVIEWDTRPKRFGRSAGSGSVPWCCAKAHCPIPIPSG